MTQKWKHKKKKHEVASFFLEMVMFILKWANLQKMDRNQTKICPGKKFVTNEYPGYIWIYIYIYNIYIFVQSPSWVGTWETCTPYVLSCFVHSKSSESFWDPWWKFVTCRASVGHYTWKHHGTQRVRCPRSYGGFILRILIGCSMKKNILRIFGVPFMESSISWGIPWLKSPNCTWLDRFASFEWWKRAVLAAPEPSNLFYGLKDRKGLCGWIVLSTSQMISNYRKLHYCWKWSVNSVLILRYPENCLLQLVHGRSCHATVQSESLWSTEASHVWRSHPFNGGWLVRFVMSMSGWASKVVKFHLPQKPLPSGND